MVLTLLIIAYILGAVFTAAAYYFLSTPYSRSWKTLCEAILVGIGWTIVSFIIWKNS